MTTFRTAARIVIKTATGAVERDWQNVDPASPNFFPFTIGEIALASLNGVESVSISLPYMEVLKGIMNKLNTGDDGDAWTIDVYLLVDGQEVFAFAGELVGGGMDYGSVMIEAGPRLSRVGDTVPPNRYVYP